MPLFPGADRLNLRSFRYTLIVDVTTQGPQNQKAHPPSPSHAAPVHKDTGGSPDSNQAPLRFKTQKATEAGSSITVTSPTTLELGA